MWRRHAQSEDLEGWSWMSQWEINYLTSVIHIHTSPEADFWVLILRPVEEKNLEIPPRVNGCTHTQLLDEHVGCVFPFLTLPVSSRCRRRAANAFHLRSVASLPPCSFTYLLCTRCCSSSLPGRSPQCLRSPAPAPWHRTRTPAARPPPGNTDKQIQHMAPHTEWVLLIIYHRWRELPDRILYLEGHRFMIKRNTKRPDVYIPDVWPSMS